ncbi:hypothetical protein J32TS2_01530 [Shouchella clausii]|nr:hypothetical protein J1TS1_01270 [Shouchella clausii]GIN14797.1 hypothetical protein J32TS2_01530 [Shouchella clausii]
MSCWRDCMGSPQIRTYKRTTFGNSIPYAYKYSKYLLIEGDPYA